MDAFADPLVHTVVVMSSAQVGKTEALNNVVAYYIDQDPSPILMLQPTLQMAEAWSKDRLAPMLRDTPKLAGKVKDARARDSGNTLLHKALALDTELPTPGGWTTMGEVKVGDWVFDEQGNRCRVTYVTPVMEGRPCYRVVFSDGAAIVADEDHPWEVQRWRVIKQKGHKPRQAIVTETVTTRDLRAAQTAKGRKVYAIPVAKPLNLPRIDLPIDPYLLGAWLGDGYSHSAAIVAGVQDAEMAEQLAAVGASVSVQEIGRRGVFQIDLDPEFGSEAFCRYGHDRSVMGYTQDGKCKECRRQRARRQRWGVEPESIVPNNIRMKLQSLGLLKRAGVGPSLKRIPKVYLRASYEQRLHLLQGLMDTDGSIRADGWCVFVTAIPEVAEGVRELLSSLGIKFVDNRVQPTYNYKGETKVGRVAYRLEFQAGPERPVFRLSRKLRRQQEQRSLSTKSTRRRVVAVEPLPSVPVRCISVDSPSHLYLVGRHMVPTHNTFPGGHITMAGANSPASLASRPVRAVLCDEVDRYPVSAGTEGDPVNLAIKRTTTFWNRKVGLTSTPTVKGLSRIEAAYQASDQRKFWVPCPDCGERQVLVWSQVKWPEGKAREAYYQCAHCGSVWDDAARWKAIRRGQWRASAPFHGTAGFHLNEIYSSWVRLGDMATAFLDAKRSPETLKTWVNTSLGETWEADHEKIDAHAFTGRLEDWGDRAPIGVLVVTAGVDVQANRFEVERVGWGIDEESWSLDHHVIHGDPSDPAMWRRLDAYLQEPTIRADGKLLPVRTTCVDSGGHHTQAVYKFCRLRRSRRVFAVKGRDEAVTIWPHGSKARKGRVADVVIVGVSAAKDAVYARLKLPHAGPGFCHFPAGRPVGWFEQLTSEVVETRHSFGRPRRVYVLPEGRRNEALDCRVYAYAALQSMQIRWGTELAALPPGPIERSAPATTDAPTPRPEAFRQQQVTEPPRRQQRNVRRSSWMGW